MLGYRQWLLTQRADPLMMDRWSLGVGAPFPQTVDAVARVSRRAYNRCMAKVHVILSDAEHNAAKREPARLGISLAELLRRSLRAMIRVDDPKPWMHFAGMVDTGDPLSSQKVDEVVYGIKR